MVAHNGREGMARYDPDAIDLVITDILMPEQDGFETITKLRQRNPQVKIIVSLDYVGGYSGSHTP